VTTRSPPSKTASRRALSARRTTSRAVGMTCTPTRCHFRRATANRRRGNLGTHFSVTLTLVRPLS
jgi:hypothetical protein